MTGASAPAAPARQGEVGAGDADLDQVQVHVRTTNVPQWRGAAAAMIWQVHGCMLGVHVPFKIHTVL